MVAPLVDKETRDSYRAAGHWGDETISDLLRRYAADRGGATAFATERGSSSWVDYDRRADEIAAALAAAAVEPGDRVGVWLPDGLDVHASMVATERIGAVAVGIGPRAGPREVGYLLARSGANTLVSGPGTHESPGGVRRIDLGEPGDPIRSDDRPVPSGGRLELPGLGPEDLFLINSTSGTTGQPKLVTQFQNRWVFFHHLVERAIDLDEQDVFMSLVSAPFGFGLWTSHFTPTLAGRPVVVMNRFSVDGAIGLMERERVTIMCCVSTQFVMMLSSRKLWTADLSSLRAIFTGGEAVPYRRAREFEEATGAKVLQFYGSNETGAYSNTSVRDSREDRLTTCGRIIPEMNARLFASEQDITASGGPGQPGCRGPATSAGYFDDPEANSRLFTADGWMLMEDVATIDERGYVRLVGRTGDFIIRGGKNISAAAAEDAVSSHPAVALTAVVPLPDEIFGERVGAFVVLREGRRLSVESLAEHLTAEGYSKDVIPEKLFVVDDLPRGPGGKIAKADLRREAARRERTDGLSSPDAEAR